MTTSNDPLVGTTYDSRYRVERRIGAGGMANVYLAEDETLGRRVAIKVLHQRYAEDSQFVERFLREASAAARLNHPNIVQVYDRGQSAGSYYIAMEYVDGMTLKDLVRRRGALSEPEVLAYGRQALHALRFAHRNGIVHRDVKPHNMMVDTDGRLKIADFGIARAGADSGLTEAGSIVGTAQYLSPEQAQGHEVSAPSDLYSLGVVMYEMSTGRVPFDGDSPVNVALKHVKDPVTPPSHLDPDISPALESIILKAMEKDAARRYPTADEMLADLDRARDGGTTHAMTQVLGGAAGATVAADAIGATRITPITPAAASNVYTNPVPPEPAWPEQEWGDDEPGRSPWRWLLPLLVLLALLGALAYFALAGGGGDPVPDVVGSPVREARSAISEAGFKVGEITFEASDEEAQGVVLDQDPGGGDRAEKGTEVDLVVSSGPEKIEVPDVVNDTRQQAIDAIVDAGFQRPGEGKDFSDDVPRGRVISQDPPAGREVPADTRITIVVSQGPEKLKVPDVSGKSEADARAILEDAGFDPERGDEQDSSRPAGTVIGQTPSAGTPLEKGGTVTLTVASGSNTVPDVTGQTADAATAALQEAGFGAEVVEEPTDDPEADGTVASTDPAAGSRREVGSTVQVVVLRFSGDDGDLEPDVAPGNGNGNANGQRRRRR